MFAPPIMSHVARFISLPHIQENNAFSLQMARIFDDSINLLSNIWNRAYLWLIIQEESRPYATTCRHWCWKWPLTRTLPACYRMNVRMNDCLERMKLNPTLDWTECNRMRKKDCHIVARMYFKIVFWLPACRPLLHLTHPVCTWCAVVRVGSDKVA